MNNIYFYELVEKAVTNKITDDEEDEPRGHLWHCEEQDMEFVQYACEKNYILAYDYSMLKGNFVRKIGIKPLNVGRK